MKDLEILSTKYIMLVKNNKLEWEEPIEFSVISNKTNKRMRMVPDNDEDAITNANMLIDNFNKSLRSNELHRELVGIKKITNYKQVEIINHKLN